MLKKLTVLSASAIALCAAPAFAGDYYIGGSVGIANQSDSDNSGQTGAFTTGDIGDGTTIDVASGTDYGWNTEFDNGNVFNIEIGKAKDNGLRLGLEAVFSNADVDTHTGVTLGGGAIGTLDAAAIAGSPTPLGVTIADVVADGQGEIKQQAVFANVYYDFMKGEMFSPYVGAGLGFSNIDVDYSPSGIQVIDDSETKFAYQVKGGATLNFDGPWQIFAEAAYRATDDVETENVLFPGSLDIENQQTTFSIGARYSFGG